MSRDGMVIFCETADQVDRVTRELHFLGYTWSSGMSLLDWRDVIRTTEFGVQLFLETRAGRAIVTYLYGRPRAKGERSISAEEFLANPPRYAEDLLEVKPMFSSWVPLPIDEDLLLLL